MGESMRLNPVIGIARLVGLTLAVIAPAASVFLTYGAAYASAGTGLVIGFLIGAVINLLVMFSYAEVGSQYPEAGGDYSLASRVLGFRIGSIYTSLFAFKGMVIPAVLSIATVSYLHALFPQIPVTVASVGVLVFYLVLSVGGLKTSSLAATIMVSVEIVMIIAFVFLALLSIHQPLGVLFSHPVMAKGHAVVAATSAGILSATVSSIFAFNGSESCLYYSEETRAHPATFGRVIMGTAITTIIVEMIAIIAATLAIPRLHLNTNATIPLATIVQHSAMGHVGIVILLAGVTIAMFDTGLAATLGYGRIYYAIARDGQWPRPLNTFFLKLNSQGVPYGPYVVLGGINLIVTVFSNLTNLVIFTGALLLALYLGVVVASLVARRRGHPPYQMPFWPVLPLLAVLAILYVLSQTSATAVLVVMGMIVLGLIWSVFAPGRRGQVVEGQAVSMK